MIDKFIEALELFRSKHPDTTIDKIQSFRWKPPFDIFYLTKEISAGESMHYTVDLTDQTVESEITAS